MRPRRRRRALAQRHPRTALRARRPPMTHRHRFAFPTTIHFGAGAREARRPAPARPAASSGRSSSPTARSRSCRSLTALRRRPAAPDSTSPSSTASSAIRRVKPGDRRRRGVPRASRRRRHRLRRRRGARRRQGGRVDGAHPRRRARVRVGPSAGASDRAMPLPYFVALPTTAGTGSEVGRSTVDLRGRDARQADHLLADAPREGGVRRSRADARPAAGDHRGDRHGRADAQRRVVPVARLPPAVRRHRARRRAHRRARAADRGARTARTSPRAATC